MQKYQNMDNAEEQTQKGLIFLELKDFSKALLSFMNAAERTPLVLDAYKPILRCMFALGESNFLRITLQQQSIKQKTKPHIFSLYIFEPELKFSDQRISIQNQRQRKKQISDIFTEIAIIFHRYEFLHDAFLYFDYTHKYLGQQKAQFYHQFQALLIVFAQRYHGYMQKSEQLSTKLCQQFPGNIKIIRDSLICAYFYGTKKKTDIVKELKELQQGQLGQGFVKNSRFQLQLTEPSQYQPQPYQHQDQTYLKFSNQNINRLLNRRQLDTILQNATKISYNVPILQRIRNHTQLLQQISSIQINLVNQCLKNNQQTTHQCFQYLQNAISFFKTISYLQRQSWFNFNLLGLAYIAANRFQQSVWTLLDAIQANPAFVNPYLNLGFVRLCLDKTKIYDLLADKFQEKLLEILKDSLKDANVLLPLALFYKIVGNEKEYCSKMDQLKRLQVVINGIENGHNYLQPKQITIFYERRQCQYLEGLIAKFQKYPQANALRLLVIPILLKNQRNKDLQAHIDSYYATITNQDNLIKQWLSKFDTIIQLAKTKNQVQFIIDHSKQLFQNQFNQQFHTFKTQFQRIIQNRDKMHFTQSSSSLSSTNQNQNHPDNHSNSEDNINYSRMSLSGIDPSKIVDRRKCKFVESTVIIQDQQTIIYLRLNRLFFELEYCLYKYIQKITKDLNSNIIQHRIKKKNSTEFRLNDQEFRIILDIEIGDDFELSKLYTPQQKAKLQARLNQIVSCLQQYGIFHGDLTWPNLKTIPNHLKVTDFDLALVYKPVSQDSKQCFDKLRQIFGTMLQIDLNRVTKKQFMDHLKFMLLGNKNNRFQYQEKFIKQLDQMLAIKLQYDRNESELQDYFIDKYIHILSKVVPQIHSLSIDKLLDQIAIIDPQ